MGEYRDSKIDELKEKLQSTLQAQIDAGLLGVSAAISTTQGIICQSTAGFADVESQEPINKPNIFGIGSITNDYLDEAVFHGIENADSATIGGLLSHTAGVESLEDDLKWIVEGRGRELDPSRIWERRDPLEYIRHPSSLTKGKFSYANTNFTLLGMNIENITGRSAEAEIRRRILEPLDLKDTFLEGFEPSQSSESGQVSPRYHFDTNKFCDTAGICPSFSEHSWKENSLIDATGSNLSVEWVTGGMISSPYDLLKMSRLFATENFSTLLPWSL